MTRFDEVSVGDIILRPEWSEEGTVYVPELVGTINMAGGGCHCCGLIGDDDEVQVLSAGSKEWTVALGEIHARLKKFDEEVNQ